MGHYAKIDSNSIVTDVIVADSTFINSLPDSSSWIKTSYNTSDGKHYVPKEHQDFSEESADQSKALRFRYAGIGMYYDASNDVFHHPRPNDVNGNPCASWTLNTSTWKWEEPFQSPTLSDIEIAALKYYAWNESLYQADTGNPKTQGWVLTDIFPT